MRVVANSQGQQVEATLDGDHPVVLVGRLRQCDLVVKDPAVSRRHCELRWKGGMVEVVDLGSTAGTYVNGKKVKTELVDPTDTVMVGSTELQLLSSHGEVGTSRRRRRGGEPPSAGRGGARRGEDDAPPRRRRSTPSPPGQAVAPPPAPPAEPSGRGRSGSGGGAAGGTGDAGAATAWLISYDTEQGPQTFRLAAGATATIGRRSDATIHVQNPTVGRKHCELRALDGGLMVEDLKSSNGTFVNGKRVRRSPLADGDVLLCGAAELRIRADPGRPTASDQSDWDDDWGDDWDDEMTTDMQPPSWHLVYQNDEGRVVTLTMSMKMRVLAIGADRDCEISVQDRGVEPEHVEVKWEEGILVARDLETEVGTLVNGKPIDEKVLRNRDVLLCGGLRVRVIRGASGFHTAGERSEDAEAWTPLLKRREDGLSMTYVLFDELDPDLRFELTVWGDGDGTVEKITQDMRETADLRVDRTTLDLVCDTLIKAHFPDVATDFVADDEDPPELELYQDGESAVVILSRKLLGRSEHYNEVEEVFRALTHEALAAHDAS